MAAWGNALGGYKLQPRIRGRFASKRGVRKAAKVKYRQSKKANAKAHRSRMKGSAKARVRETVTTAPRRSRQMVAGTAVYVFGKQSGSARAQTYGMALAKKGAKASGGRVRATRAMSKGLKKSRNRQAKDRYYREVGTSRSRRNAMKIAGVVGVAAAAGAAYKRGNIRVGKTGHGAFVGARAGKVRVRAYASRNGFAQFSANGKYVSKDFGQVARNAKAKARKRGVVI